MNRPLLNREDFAAFWDRLNATFPPFKMSPDELASAARIWYDVLQEFSINTLHSALISVSKRTDRRPHPSMLVEAAHQLLRSRPTPHVSHATDDRTCPCGCGGVRWYEIMLDAEHRPRRYAEGPWAGQEMLRPKWHCRRSQIDVPGGEQVSTADGMPVHLPAGYVRPEASHAA